MTGIGDRSCRHCSYSLVIRLAMYGTGVCHHEEWIDVAIIMAGPETEWYSNNQEKKETSDRFEASSTAALWGCMPHKRYALWGVWLYVIWSQLFVSVGFVASIILSWFVLTFEPLPLLSPLNSLYAPLPCLRPTCCPYDDHNSLHTLLDARIPTVFYFLIPRRWLTQNLK